MRSAKELTMKLTGSKFIDDVDPNSMRIAADSITVSFIQQIQLDAMKEGMRRAARISTGWHDYDQSRTSKPVTDAIIKASEQLTIKDL